MFALRLSTGTSKIPEEFVQELEDFKRGHNMFTGLVETTGKIESINEKGDMIVLEVVAKNESYDSEHGASIAINGCCLTVTEFEKNKFFFDVSIETLNKKTTLGQLKVGHEVNMEELLLSAQN